LDRHLREPLCAACNLKDQARVDGLSSRSVNYLPYYL
jgi:hypothetical protein